MVLHDILLGFERSLERSVQIAKAVSTKSVIRNVILVLLVIVLFFVVAPWLRIVSGILLVILLVWKIYIEIRKIILLQQEANANQSQAPPNK